MDRAQRFMIVAGTISIAAHLGLLIPPFKMPPGKPHNAVEMMEIILVNQRTTTTPAKHDVLAQANLDGGGNTDAKVRAKSPLPANPDDQTLQQAVQQQKKLEDQADKMMTQLKADHKLSSADKSTAVQPEDNGLDPETIKQQLRMSALAAQIDQEHNAYNERPRKTFIGVRAKQTSVAMWDDAWRQKIEQTGTYAYPVDAHGKKLRGRLSVTVEIGADGSIQKAYIERSSGNKELDDAALRILKLASPFSRLPGDMLDESGKPSNILVITRTWIFGKNDTLETTSGK